MKVIELPINKLNAADWNPNKMNAATLNRLKESLSRYGLVTPLVVRPLGDAYEVLSGNQRLKAIEDMEISSVPCIVVVLNDHEAMLLAQALNGLRGEDDLAMKGSLLRKVLESVPEKEVLSLLPETMESLRTLSTISQADIAEHLAAWDKAQSARLRHMQLQFTHHQLETVEEAVSRILPSAKDEAFENPNNRGNAVFLLCRYYLERSKPE